MSIEQVSIDVPRKVSGSCTTRRDDSREGLAITERCAAQEPGSDRLLSAAYARAILSLSDGWFRWNSVWDCPDWVGERIELDGRFTVDDLRALIALRTLVR